jgi:hypothetical protein
METPTLHDSGLAPASDQLSVVENFRLMSKHFHDAQANTPCLIKFAGIIAHSVQRSSIGG